MIKGVQRQLDKLSQGTLLRGKTVLEAAVVSRPALTKRDGVSDNVTWCCDVTVGGVEGAVLENVPIAHFASSDLSYLEVGAAVVLTCAQSTGYWEITGYSKRKPGFKGSKAVTIPPLNAVSADRSGSDLLSGSTTPAAPLSIVVGSTVDLTITSRVLTLEELSSGTYGLGFGYVPLGSYAIFQGSTLLEVRT